MFWLCSLSEARMVFDVLGTFRAPVPHPARGCMRVLIGSLTTLRTRYKYYQFSLILLPLLLYHFVFKWFWTFVYESTVQSISHFWLVLEISNLCQICPLIWRTFCALVCQIGRVNWHWAEVYKPTLEHNSFQKKKTLEHKKFRDQKYKGMMLVRIICVTVPLSPIWLSITCTLAELIYHALDVCGGLYSLDREEHDCFSLVFWCLRFYSLASNC